MWAKSGECFLNLDNIRMLERVEDGIIVTWVGGEIEKLDGECWFEILHQVDEHLVVGHKRREGLFGWLFGWRHCR